MRSIPDIVEAGELSLSSMSIRSSWIESQVGYGNTRRNVVSNYAALGNVVTEAKGS